jgi:hypothetical protein
LARKHGDETDAAGREQEIADAMAEAHAEAEAKQLDVAPEGGRYIRGGRRDAKTGRHYGGEVVDAEGKVLATFDDKQENTGDPKAGKKPPEPPPDRE